VDSGHCDLANLLRGTQTRSCTCVSPRTDSTTASGMEARRASTKGTGSRQPARMPCQYYIWCQAQTLGTSDVASHLDKVSVNRAIVGGERERGANERIQ